MRILLIALLCVCMLPLKAQNKGQQRTQKPNIIFILTDDQRYDALGYAGNQLISTPEMDQLAQAGTFFAFKLTPLPTVCSRATRQPFVPWPNGFRMI